MPNLRFSFADVHNRLQPGGWARQVTGRELPIAQALNCVNMRLKAGAVREMHWHEPDEWGFVLKGRMRITAVDEDGHAFQDDVGEGDIWNFPGGIPHSIQGLEGDGCEFLLVFDDGNFNEDETFLVTDFLAHIPKEVLAKNFGVPESAFANIPKEELYIFESQVPGPLAADRVAGAGPVPSSLQPPADGPGADPHEGGQGPHRRLLQFPGGQGRSPPRWSRSSPAGCASCTGTRTRTSCNTTSRASRG